MQIIAEFCQNHNGDFEVLKDMIFLAKENGANYGKIQNIFADNLTLRKRFENGLIENNIVKVIKRPYESEYERLKKLELSYELQADFIEICRKVNLKPLTTIFSRDSLKKIISIGFKDIKIASYDCASEPLIRDVSSNFNHIFVSTGATFDKEIRLASSLLKDCDFTFFHCVTKYPTPLEEFNLKRMNYLRKFTNSVGWSDHSLVKRDGIKGTLAAIFYGADFIERHFTILPSSKTKDGPISITPKQLKDLVEFSKLDQKEKKIYLNEHFPDHSICLGMEKRKLSSEELLNRDYYRGRFASFLNEKIIYNWEDKNI